MRILAVLSLLAGLVLIPAGAACACSCAPFEPVRAAKETPLIFTGTVTDLRPAPSTGPAGPTPMIATIQADHLYKGEPRATYEVATASDSAACGYNFSKGTRYLVYAGTGESGLLGEQDPGTGFHTSLCSGNAVVAAGRGPVTTADFPEPAKAEAVLDALPAPQPAPAGRPTGNTSDPAQDPSAVPAAGSGAASPPSPLVPAVVAGAAAVLGLLTWLLVRRRRTPSAT
ncbi:hypothetical protein [Nonomuraea sp. NPDC050310]|uniref:hypothetical protein n=1 Tax=unclassified Nonomuraea TaxID=2593643 RepID=UPI0033FEE78D